MTKRLQIAKDFSFEAAEYASQGNAILGIRDSGKTYTATLLAEQLLAAGIPIVAFDPIGVWRYLKQGKNGQGFPIVVAGGESGDLELTPESAPLIVRAAMKENIPLVLDLYSMQLSKSDWKRIVADSVRLLLYENKTQGLRHIFIEEAAEFCPQRVGPDSGIVYAEIEKLARMGGNASLGYTLINQRSEEVNKAVLELCDCLLLHRQKGRHSLTALSKWLDVADADNKKAVIKSLPTLGQGRCWVWNQGSTRPKQIQVNEKTTIHPDRRRPNLLSQGTTADVGDFVSILKAEISKQPSKKEPERKERLAKASLPLEDDQLERLTRELDEEREKRRALEKILESLRKTLSPFYQAFQGIFEKTEGVRGVSPSAYEPFLEKLPGKNREMLRILIEEKALTKDQLAFRVGMVRSGSFTTYLGNMKRLGLTEQKGDQIVLRQL
jgi:hypothetical protein